jgi:hypothetical protein
MKRQTDIFPLLFIVSLLLAGIFSRCAKVVNPTGGPKDTIPPVAVREVPPNYSIHFDEKKIEIYFSEYIQLKDLKKQFISSPPFSEDPVIIEKGDELEIELKDTLRDSTTYTLNFGNSIVDFRESNPLKNYRYVFSTGDELDSLEVTGKIVDAFTLEPKENVLVMLYSKIQDSIPFQELPEYVSRTDEKGQYYIGNIRMDTFKIFALEDVNNNYLYDSPEEYIGYSDSLVQWTKDWIRKHDTIFQDSILPPDSRQGFVDSIIRITNGTINTDTLHLGESDSVLIDTVFLNEYYGYTPESRKMRMFDEENRIQYLKTAIRPDKRKISFVFNRPVIDSIRYQFIDSSEVPQKLHLPAQSVLSDTMSYWLRDSSIFNREKLTYRISYKRRDSLNQYYWHRDTMELRYTEKKAVRKTKTDTLAPNLNIAEGKPADLDQLISLTFKYPLQSFDTSRICLWRKQDTLLVEQEVKVYQKPENIYTLYIEPNWEPESDYRLRILPQTVHTIYDFYHDTVDLDFATRRTDYYGNIALTVSGMEGAYMVQLIQDKEKVVKEEWVEDGKTKTIPFSYIDPGKYGIRLIDDENRNKEWDTGNYLENKQPENVYYYPEKINVRANWDLDLEWKLPEK